MSYPDAQRESASLHLLGCVSTAAAAAAAAVFLLRCSDGHVSIIVLMIEF